MRQSKKVGRLVSAKTQQAYHCCPLLCSWQTLLIDHSTTKSECYRGMDAHVGYSGLGRCILKYNMRDLSSPLSPSFFFLVCDPFQVQ